MRGEGEVRFVDIAEGGGGASGEEGGDPMACGIADGGAAEGVDMNGDGAADEAEIGADEGAGSVFGIPAEVEGGVFHGVGFGEEFGAVIEDHGGASAAGFFDDGVEPFIAFGVAFVGDVAGIDVGETGEAFLFGGEGIGDHFADDVWGGAIEAGDEEDFWVMEVFDGGEATVVGVIEGAGDLAEMEAEGSEFGVYGSGVDRADGRRAVLGIAGVFGAFGDFQGDATDEGDEADLVGFDGTEGVIGGAKFPPGVGGHGGADGFGDGSIVFIARDFLGFGAFEAEEMVFGDVAFFGVETGEFGGVFVVEIVDDERGAGVWGGRCGGGLGEGEGGGEEEENGGEEREDGEVH